MKCDHCGRETTATINGTPFCDRPACRKATERGLTAAGKEVRKTIAGVMRPAEGARHMDELEKLPKGLSADDVRMVVAEIGDLPEWPAGAGYTEAQLPAGFAKLLRKAYHGELEGAHIAHLFKQQLGGHGGCKVIARAKKASPELAFLADVDFVILYSWRAWGSLILWQRLAVVDHELSHCGRDPETGWITIPHDLEEFGTIARRWGDWQPGITDFRRQLDLFAGTASRR